MVTPTSTSSKPSSSATKYQRLCPLCLKDPKSSLKQSSGSSKKLTLMIKAAFLWHLLGFALDVFSIGGLLKVSATNFGVRFFSSLFLRWKNGVRRSSFKYSTSQPRPQGFSLKKWVKRYPFFEGKALGTRLLYVTVNVQS